MKQKFAKDWAELRSLKKFRSAVDKSELSSALLVGEYAMSPKEPMEPCGIRQCRTAHRNGFIIELKDGSVSHVGGYCGKKHFGATTWKARLRNFRAATKAQAKQTALHEARTKAQAILSAGILRPDGLDRTQKMLAEFDRLPASLRDTLIAKAQDRTPDILRYRSANEKEIREAKFYGKPKPGRISEVVGRLEGLDAILPSRRADRIWRESIPYRIKILDRSSRDSEGDPFEAIRAFELEMANLQKSIADARLFFSNENIRRLSLLPAFQRLGLSTIQTRDVDDFLIEIS